MPTLKIQKADGTFEFLQLAGEEFADIGNQVLDVKSQLAHTTTEVSQLANLFALDYATLKSGNIYTIDLPRLQSDLNQIKGSLEFPDGIFEINGSLAIPRGVQIKGKSRESTELRGLTSLPVVILGTNTQFNGIYDLTINGNNISQNGLFLERQQRFDCWFIADRLTVINCVEDGIKLGNNILEAKILSVTCYNNGGFGVNLTFGATDNMIQNTVCYLNGGGGFGIFGFNNKYVNCKAYFNGTTDIPKHGFEVNGRRNTITACESQDNFGHGAYVYNCASNSFVNFLGDCNGNIGGTQAPETPVYVGILVENCGSTSIQGMFTDYRRSVFGKSTQKAGVEVKNSNTITIIATCIDMPNTVIIDNATKQTKTTTTVINGKMDFLSNFDPWKDLTLLNGATNSNPTNFNVARYKKDNENFVHLQGRINVTTHGHIFTFPDGYKPSKTLRFVVSTGEGYGVILIYSSGAVVTSGGGISDISLDGVIFEAV